MLRAAAEEELDGTCSNWYQLVNWRRSFRNYPEEFERYKESMSGVPQLSTNLTSIRNSISYLVLVTLGDIWVRIPSVKVSCNKSPDPLNPVVLNPVAFLPMQTLDIPI